jgi:DNA-binding transcriptional regulator YiaG
MKELITALLAGGERWQSEIGRALGVTARTVRRWAAGETAPDDIRPKVLELITKRIGLLQQIKVRLS